VRSPIRCRRSKCQATELEAGIGLLSLVVKAGLPLRTAKHAVTSRAVRCASTTSGQRRAHVCRQRRGDADGVIKLSLGKKKHILIKPV
jgi:tyrosyl-tRNA synthetase